MPAENYTYTVVYQIDAESGAFCASVPALELGTYGADLQEARAHMLEALGLHLEGLREEGMPIPSDVVLTERVSVQLPASPSEVQA